MVNAALTTSIPPLSMNSQMQPPNGEIAGGKPAQHAVHLDHARLMAETWPDVKEELI